MSFKTTLVLFLVATAVVGFYFFADKGPSTEELAKTAKRVFPDWTSGDIVKISIAAPATATAGVVLSREKKDDAPWRLEKPVAVEASREAVDSLLSNAQYAERQEKYDEYDARSLGLDAPRARVVFGKADGRELVLLFGREDPTGKYVYAQVEGQKPALVLPERLWESLVKKAEDLREKRIFTLDTWTIDRVTLEGAREGNKIRFKKDGDFWLIDGPEPEHADKRKVDELVSTLTGLRVKRFIEDGATDLEKYGLKSPNATVTLEGKGATETALFGGKAEGGPNEVYARRGERPDVVTVDDKLTSLVHWDLDRWRSKTLLHIGRERIESIEVRPADGAAARLVHQGFEWRFAEPRTATADTRAADDLSRALGEIEVARVAREKPDDLANFGLDRPAVATVTTPKAKHGFKLGRASARENGWYAQREGKEAVLEIVFPQAQSLIHMWPVLRDKQLTSLAPEDVVRLEVARDGGEAQPFVRLPEGGGWSTPGGAKVDAAAANEVAAKLAELDAARILAPVEDPVATGLKAPWLSIRATVKPKAEGAALETIVIELGKATAERDRHARLVRGDETIHFTLAEDAVNVLAKELRLPEEKETPKDAPKDVPAPATGTGR